MTIPATTEDDNRDLAITTEEPDTDSEMTMEELFAKQEDFSKKLSGREIVKVKVIHLGDEYVFVDIGEKKEGLIPRSDFKDEKNQPAVGADIFAVLEKRGGEERHAILSHLRAAEMFGWESCKQSFAEKSRVKGTVAECIKGGYIVDVFGLRAFMPLSLSELHPAYKHHLPVGAKIRCQIVEMSRDKKRVIVSRRQVLEEDEGARRGKVMGEIKEGDILRVVVAKVGKEIMHLRFHGIEGIVRLPNVSWRKPEEAINTYKRGQRLKAKLLKLDPEKKALEFGLKQLYTNPADILRRKYQSKTVVKGKVLESKPEGLVIAVAPDVEGFVPITEYGPEVQYQPGDAVSTVVLGVNNQTFQVTLSIKRFDEVQNRKIIAHYLKEAPPLTLGQLLTGEKEG